jgi:hypothetical protein
MEPGAIYWRVIEPIWNKVSIYYGPDTFRSQFENITERQQHLFATHWCQSEVCNGGFHQFFTNATGLLAPEAVAGFRAIGLNRCAAIVEEAASFFGSPYPRLQELRTEILEVARNSSSSEGNPFSHLDHDFYIQLGSPTEGFNARFLTAADNYASSTALRLNS